MKNKGNAITAAPLLKNLYRQVSGGLLGLAVKSKLIGEIPQVDSPTSRRDFSSSNDQPREDAPTKLDNHLTFYVLKEYSRSNSVLIDLETKQHQLPPALANVIDRDHGIDENTAMIFLHHHKTEQPPNHPTIFSPRLLKLIDAVEKHPNLTIQVVPVTILWGRAPEKEDSLFNLLTADEWQVPSITKQLFNIGVK